MPTKASSREKCDIVCSIRIESSRLVWRSWSARYSFRESKQNETTSSKPPVHERTFVIQSEIVSHRAPVHIFKGCSVFCRETLIEIILKPACVSLHHFCRDLARSKIYKYSYSFSFVNLIAHEYILQVCPGKESRVTKYFADTSASSYNRKKNRNAKGSWRKIETERREREKCRSGWGDIRELYVVTH